MATVETFETTLKDVVGAKRLSASKMTSLTEIALKCMENDTKLVSILYRTHKALPPSAKTSSLYVFDALSRAARNQVTKHNLTGDIYSEKGNSATFLLKIEGILDSLFQDLATSGTQELKEKAKKILDIWVKSSTFPSAVLARLSKLLMGAAEKEPDKVVSTSVLRNHQSPPTSTTPPGPPPTVPPTTTPALPPTNGPSVDAVQSTLFALLSQAANAVASNGQTPPNSATLSAPAPVLDANQLALFQQLTQTAKLGSAFPTQQPIPLPVSLVPSSSTKPVPVPPVGGPSQPPPYRDDHYGSGRRESHYNRQAGPERGRDRDDYYDARRDRGRGGFRGGSRGRARGRWDDRDRHKDRNRDRDWAPAAPYKGRRSRSRSPPNRPSGPRGARPYSPPRRPSVAHSEGRHAAGPSADKDEFGRDLRAESPKESTESHSASHRSLSPPASAPAPNPVPTYTGAQSPPPAQPTPGNVATQSSTSPPPPALAAQSLSLETFSPATFDPSSPEAWTALGQAWAGSNGYLPSQEELMSFAMGSGIIPGISLNSNFGTPAAGPWQGDGNWAMTDVPAQAGGMNVGHGYGNDRAMEYAGEQAYEQQSLGGGLGRFGAEGMAGYGSDPAWAGAADEVDSYAVPMDQEKGGGEAAMSSGGLPGRMERVGDKWVFVRRETSVV